MSKGPDCCQSADFCLVRGCACVCSVPGSCSEFETEGEMASGHQDVQASASL